MTIKDCEESVAVTEVEIMDACIFHGFAPPCIKGRKPCISADTNSSHFPFSDLVFLSLMGSERYTPIVSS